MSSQRKSLEGKKSLERIVAYIVILLIGGCLIGMATVMLFTKIGDAKASEAEEDVIVIFKGIATACWDLRSVQAIIKAETERGENGLHAKFRALFPDRCGFYPGSIGELEMMEPIKSTNPSIDILPMKIPFSGKIIYFTVYNTNKKQPPRSLKNEPQQEEVCHRCI